MTTTITINGVDYVPATEAPAPSPLKIVFLQRGNVLIGRYQIDEFESDQRVLVDASVIRYWGTTKGIGEIAAGGPTSKTRLDPCGRVEFHVLTQVMAIDADEAKWAGHL